MATDDIDLAWQQSSSGEAQGPGTTPGLPSPAKTKLSSKQIQKNVQSEAGVPDETTFGDYAWDAAVGVGAGVEGFFKSIGALADNIGEAVGVDIADDSVFENQIKTKTWVGGLTSGITQFAIGFVPIMNVAGLAGKAMQVGKLGKLALTMGAGMAADFVAFKEHEERLSNLVQQVPALQNPVTEYLAADADDGWAEGRFKNAIEGLGLGAVTDVLGHALRGFKAQMLAKGAGDAAAFAKAGDDAAKALEPLLKQIDESKIPVASELDAGQKGALDALSEQRARDAANVGKTEVDALKLLDGADDIAKQFVERVRKGGKLEDVAHDAVATWLNTDRIKSTKSAKGMMTLLNGMSDKLIQHEIGGVMPLKQAKALALESLEEAGISPVLFEQLASDEAAIRGMAVRTLMYRAAEVTLATKVSQMARTLKGAATIPDEFLGLAKMFTDLRTRRGVIQTEGARITTFGNVKIGPADLDTDEMFKTISKTLDGGNGAKAKEALVTALTAADGDPKAMSGIFKGAETFVSKAVGVHNEYWINAVLSGIHTQVTNFMSQAANTFLMPAERIMGGLWKADAAMMKSGGRMYLNVVSAAMDVLKLSSTAEKLVNTHGSSVGNAAKAFWHDQPLLDALSREPHTARHAISAKNLGLQPGMLATAIDYLGKTVRMPTRFMMGMDELFKQINYRAYLRDEGFRLASERGINDGTELAKFVEAHVMKGFDDLGKGLNEAATKYAQESTFTEKLLPGTLGKSIQDAVNEHPGLRLLMPFVKAPTNIFRRAWQYTPGLNFIQGEFRRMWESKDPVEQAVARGRTMLGGVFWTTGIGLAQAGKLTGGGPSNKEERDAWLAAGNRPYSIVFNNEDGTKEYFDYRRMEPFVYFLSLAADFTETMGSADDEDTGAVASALMITLAKNLGSKTYLTGLTELVNVLGQPDRHALRWLQQRAGSYVPNLVARANDDDYMREARTLMDAVRRRIPGYSETLPPRRNLLGEPITPPGGYMPFVGGDSWLGRQLSPVAYSKSVSDPVKTEIAKLQYGFAMPRKTYRDFDLREFRNRDGKDAYDHWLKLHGEVKIGGKTLAESLERLIGSERYKAMPAPSERNDQTNPRVQAVQKVISDYRERAFKQTLRDFSQIGRALRLQDQQARQQRSAADILAAL